MDFMSLESLMAEDSATDYSDSDEDGFGVAGDPFGAVGSGLGDGRLAAALAKAEANDAASLSASFSELGGSGSSGSSGSVMFASLTGSGSASGRIAGSRDGAAGVWYPAGLGDGNDVGESKGDVSMEPATVLGAAAAREAAAGAGVTSAGSDGGEDEDEDGDEGEDGNEHADGGGGSGSGGGGRGESRDMAERVRRRGQGKGMAERVGAGKEGKKKGKGKGKGEENDTDPLYDPKMDDADEAWVRKHLRKQQRPCGAAAAGAGGSEGEGEGKEQGKGKGKERGDPEGAEEKAGASVVCSRRPPCKNGRCGSCQKVKKGKAEGEEAGPARSDAMLSCPCCFTVVSLDCQRHTKYHNQYRALFVLNCRINRDEGVRMGGDDGEDGEDGEQGEDVEGAASGAPAGGPGTGPVYGQPTAPEGEILYPVHCTQCGGELGLYSDDEECYHLFNVFPSNG
jgi:hypothetical protein